MTTEHEVERLVEVYRVYRDSTRIQSQWDVQNAGNRAILEERNRAVLRILRRYGFQSLADCKILEVGCGSGRVLGDLLDMGARPENLYGVDLMAESIDEARRLYPEVQLTLGNAERLAFPGEFFDLIVLFTVFSSILDEMMRRNVAQEAMRTLRKGGAVLWYDFRYDNPSNPNVRGVTRSRIHQLFSDLKMDLRSITVLPPLSRRLGWLAPSVYPLLALIPPLRTHYLGLLVKESISGW